MDLLIFIAQVETNIVFLERVFLIDLDIFRVYILLDVPSSSGKLRRSRSPHSN